MPVILPLRIWGRKKQALFVILPDEKTTFYPIASLIVSQQYELLAEAADQAGAGGWNGG